MAAETWISVDVETSGPTPNTGSLLSIGACLVDDPERGIELLLRPEPGLPWSDDAEAIHRLDRATLERDGMQPAVAMAAFHAWLDEVVPAGSRPVFVALNAPFDWMFVADAFWRHLDRNPFGHSALDIKALYLGRHAAEVDRWSETARVSMLERYPVTLPHTHTALADAREQAAIFRAILSAVRDEVTAVPAGAQPAGPPLPRGLGAPAIRALTEAGYTGLDGLASVPASQLLGLHGMGPKALSRLQEALEELGLSLGPG